MGLFIGVRVYCLGFVFPSVEAFFGGENDEVLCFVVQGTKKQKNEESGFVQVTSSLVVLIGLRI